MATKPTKHLEVETYYLHGVGVNVEINYVTAKIGLVNLDNNRSAKSWVFAGRSIEYMAGWQNILDAMKYAIEEAEKKLQKHLDEKEKALARQQKDFMEVLKDEKKKGSSW